MPERQILIFLFKTIKGKVNYTTYLGDLFKDIAILSEKIQYNTPEIDESHLDTHGNPSEELIAIQRS